MIRVIIERQIAPTLEEAYEIIAKKTLQKAIQAPGFISGESLKEVNHPNRRIILSTWKSTTDWHRWYSSNERKNMIAEFSPILESEEKYLILETA